MAGFVIGSRGRKVKFACAPRSASVAEKLIAYSKDAEGGCRIWLRKLRSGYGRIHLNGSPGLKSAHRVSYETFVGPIPDGLQIDHLCRNTACINPAHLEPVTPHENARRGTVWDHNRAKTKCPKGHPYSIENTHVRKNRNSRECRECMRARTAAKRKMK